MNHLSAIKNTLPNFPDHVIDQWIAPFAKTEGWPPDYRSDRWKYILRKRDVEFWKDLSWKLEEFELSPDVLNYQDLQMITDLVLADVKNVENFYSLSIPSSKERFWGICDYMKVYGVYPKPVIIMKIKNKYSFLDGCHRYAAFLFLYGYFKIDHVDSPCLKVIANQKYWVAEPKRSH
jgi:hypothetical protein